MKRGQPRNKERNKEIKKHTSRLLDQLGPEGRVGENIKGWVSQKLSQYTIQFKHASILDFTFAYQSVFVFVFPGKQPVI